MDLKSLLKTLKLNESTISMAFGALVILIAGILVLNYFRKDGKGVTLPTGDVTEEKSEGPTITRDGKVIHIVQSNDNLWKISERYYNSGYNWVDIANTNNLKNPGLIVKDQELEIPSVDPKKETVLTKTDEVKEKVKISIIATSYTVAKGDHLWDISVRAYGDGYQWVKIARENKLYNPNLIHSGNVLIIPK